MRTPRWVALLVVAILAGAGCQSGMRSPRALASNEPTLNPKGSSDSMIVESPPPKQVTIVDRHPLLYKPREYYDSSGNNTLVKAAAATFIGVPAGIFGEMRQVVVGRPPDSQPY
jgi:hypothetical protein